MPNRLDKPVHKVLEDYDLLEVNVIQNRNTLNMSAGMLWVSKRSKIPKCRESTNRNVAYVAWLAVVTHNSLIRNNIAMNYKIYVYTLDTINSPFKDPVKTLTSDSAARTGGGTESPFIINAIKVGRMLGTEVLVSVSEMGEICIWKTEDLDEPPLILNNNGIATWGIAIHGDQGLLAVSANNFKIAVFNIAEMTTKFGKRSSKEPNYLGTAEKIELEGHEHNIPNIDFNETGRYIASVSVDTTCRIWDVSTRRMVTQKRSSSQQLSQDAWCWSAKFIKPGSFKHVVCNDEEISKLYQQRVYQGRSTCLASLGLCHSANNPAFPINVSRVFDLEEEDIDFEIYEGEGEGELDDDTWDARLMEEEDNHMEEVYERQRMEDELEYNLGDQDQDPDEASEIIHPVSQQDNDDEYDTAEEEEEEYDDHDDDRDGPAHLMLSLISAAVDRPITEAEWTATIRTSSDSNVDGWGDPLPAVAGQDSASTTDDNNGWETTTDSNEAAQMEEDTEPEAAASGTQSPSYCIPNVIRATSSSSSIPQLIPTTATETPKPAPKDKHLGEYVMITTSKDVMLASTTLPRMNKIRVEHDMIYKVDIRSDQLLSILDRINMVEWLPELELFVVASQKGTVALMRLLQVEFENGHQACLFNNEHYLPINVLQSTPLYGLTVKKIESERYAPVSYQIFLFYYGGNVLAYTVSRKEDTSIYTIN
ncbi:hypothetical protein MAM1_0141c06424 [Mucor ambiguus]|uniref:Uncharacterized protein n=1 Tax=Mucor ambiguus TaxID=91626 RepID=A0A0C9MHX7_9FUNG|nr:hypothetical protein MAM1_0141c06424 [Mucor ambiguus]